MFKLCFHKQTFAQYLPFSLPCGRIVSRSRTKLRDSVSLVVARTQNDTTYTGTLQSNLNINTLPLYILYIFYRNDAIIILQI